MGKKSKVGKQRKDKYYQLAKETGYRSRAAFKLIQLNRKFGFLQKSRVCIDLCAAPGGWMQGYIAPDSIDPKFLDAKYVFEDLEIVKKQNFNIMHPEKQKKAKAEGYKENDYTTHHKVLLSEFLSHDDPIDLLQGCSEIVIDDKNIETHPKTTTEIKECCKDIKVLGRKDLKALLSWIKQIKEWKTSLLPSEDPTLKGTLATDTSEKAESGDENNDVDMEVAGLQDEERRQLKRKRKQLNKQRQKLAEKMNLKMVLKGDGGPIMESHDMFRLSDIKNTQELNHMLDQQPDIVAEGSDESDDELKSKPKYIKYDIESSKLDSSGLFYKDSDSDIEMETDSEDEKDKESLAFSDSDNESKKIAKLTKLNTLKNSKIEIKPSIPKNNPLLTDLDNTDPMSKRSMKAELWFQKDSFKEIDEDDDEGVDLDKLAETYRQKGKKVPEDNTYSPAEKVSIKKLLEKTENSESDDSSESDYDVEDSIAPVTKASGKSSKKDSFEVVSQDPDLKRIKKTLKMDAETLALGTMIATSKKFKRDLIDDAWNRYAFNDKNLPDWFTEDEKKHMRKDVIVPEKYVEEYRNRTQEINVRPIKKVIEAKARKKKRMIKKMERAKKKVEAVMDNADMSEREKAQQIKQLYKKAKTDGKKKVTYVVAKKHTSAKRMKRPAGVKGHYKVVDPRMKKDLRAQKAKEKTKGRGKKGTANNRAPPKKKGTKKKAK
ncbi:unnamed protein product, partial [Iphiclides podalirius]